MKNYFDQLDTFVLDNQVLCGLILAVIFCVAAWFWAKYDKSIK
jgi:ABC-type uncharacterized transport system permease subunit